MLWKLQGNDKQALLIEVYGKPASHTASGEKP